MLERTNEESLKAVESASSRRLASARAAVYKGERHFDPLEISVDDYLGYVPSSASIFKTIDIATTETLITSPGETDAVVKIRKGVRFSEKITLLEIYERLGNSLIRSEEERLYLLLNVVGSDQIFKGNIGSPLNRRAHNRVVAISNYLAADLGKLYSLGKEEARVAQRIFLNNLELMRFNPSLCMSCFNILLDISIYRTGEAPIDYYEKGASFLKEELLFEKVEREINKLPIEFLNAYRIKLVEEGVIQLYKAGTASARRVAIALVKCDRSLYFYNKAFFNSSPEFTHLLADYLYCEIPSAPELKSRRHYFILQLLNSSELTPRKIDKAILQANIVVLFNDIMELKERDYEATFYFYKFSKILETLPELIKMLLKNKSFLSWASSDIINYCLSQFVKETSYFIGIPPYIVVRKTIGIINVIPYFPNDFVIAFELAYPCLWYISLMEGVIPYFKKVAIKIIKNISHSSIDFSRFELEQINNLLQLLEGVTEARCLAFQKILNDSLNIYWLKKTLTETEESNVRDNAKLLIDKSNILVLSNICEERQRMLANFIFYNLERIFGNEVLYTASNRVLDIHPFIRDNIHPGAMPSLKCMRIVFAETFSQGYIDQSLIHIAATIMKGLSKAFYHTVSI